MMEKASCVQGVVKLLDVVDDGLDHMVFVMPAIENCMDLFDYIGNQPNYVLTESVARLFFKQIYRIVVDLFKINIVHRDIKDENFIVNLDTLELHLIDFGCADFVSNSPYFEMNGTLIYQPPEWFTESRVDAEKSTVWTLGCILFVMLDRITPHASPQEIVQNNIRVINNVSHECMDLIRHCLATDEHDRYSLDQINNHIWMTHD
jgi:proto-oncogene serine/threonine-protein kinase Pim-1/proto-oncogene serine/threonine-protein kinase Pim-3